MGKLKQLELENFKSYAGKQIVGPFDDFTCIIGPNGAGKSNMMDAISFVLGIQSKHLRSSQLKDLIYRKDLDSTTARKATVKLIYEASAGEISSDSKGCEMSFSRSISSSGVTSYQIDNKDVTYEVYEKTLSNIGVLVKARNFLVFQGDIESIAQKSPAELAKLIEQISGSELLKDEYTTLLNKKNEIEENILLMMQKKKLFINQRKEVKDQKDEAESFVEKQAELDDVKSKMILWKIWKIKNQVNKKEETAKSIEADLDLINLQEPEIDSLIANEKIELAKTNKSLVKLEKDLMHEQKKVETNKNDINQMNATLSSLLRRQSELKKTFDNIDKDITKQRVTISLMESELDKLNREEYEVKNELSQISTSNSAMSVHLDENHIEDYLSLREQAASLTASDRTKNEIIQQDIKCIQLRLEQLDKDHLNTKQEYEYNEKIYKDYQTRVSQLQQGMQATEEDLKHKKVEKETSVEQFQLNIDNIAKMKVELHELNMKLSEATDDQRRSKHELKEAEAVEAMKRIFSGVHGKLVDLCRPYQKKYAQAIAVAAGRQMDAIVVESKQVASDCINYLKDQRIGSCVFLPLDNLRVQPIPDRLRSLGAKYHVCYDLIECEDKFKSAVAYAVGSTMVCDSLEEAQELCFVKNEKVKAVTLKGHVIGKTGAMTGGSNLRENQDRWRDKEIDEWRTRKQEIDEFLSLHSKSLLDRQNIIELENNYQITQSKLQFTQAEYEIVQQKLIDIQKQMKQKSLDIKAIEKEIETQQEKLTQQTQLFNDIQQGIDQIENQIFNNFSAQLGITNIRQHEEKMINKHQELFNKRKSINERQTDLKTHLEFESKKQFKIVEKRVQTQLNQVDQDIAIKQNENTTLLQKQETLNKSVAKLTKDVNSMKKERNQRNESMKEYQMKKHKLSKEKNSFLNQLSIEEIGFEKLRAQLHEILQKAQIEEIVLPTVDLETNSSDSVSGSSQNISDSQQNESSSSRVDAPVSSGSGGKGSGHRGSSFWHDNLLKWEGGTQSQSQQRKTADKESSEESSASTVSNMRSKGSNSTHFSQSQNTVVRQDVLKMRRVDLSSIEKQHRSKHLNDKQIDQEIENYDTKISALLTDIQNMQPNMHATERYDGVVQRLQETSDDLEEVKREAREISEEFEIVKKKRQELFDTCYQHVSEALSVIYRDLTCSSKHPVGGKAFLSLENTDEPYLSGVRFTAMPPMKRFRDMDQLSGGEKTIAALALLFSIHSFRQAPFFVLDEIDAALDNVNVKKVCNYIRQRSKDFQCLVISLKDIFYENADILVGVCKDVKSFSSQILTLDMKQYNNIKPPGSSSETLDDVSEEDKSFDAV